MANILHIVLCRWSPTATLEQQLEVRDQLHRLAQSIPGITSLRDGPSVSPEGLEDGYDYGFVMDFASATDRDSYLTHPSHQRFADKLGAVVRGVLVFDLGAAPLTG